MHNYEKVRKDLIKITKNEVLGKLPDPFVMNDGTRLTDKADWEKRREEIYKTAVELQYGVMPPEPEFLEVQHISGGLADGFVNYLIKTGTREKPIVMTMVIMKPAGKPEGKLPAVINGDRCFKYCYDKEYISTFTDNGFMLVMFNRTELVPDDINEGRKGQLYETYPQDNYGATAAWAWGYSRCVDALEKIGIADMDKIVFTGHSRGGKTALLAGAVDRRAAIVNPNSTCAGGAACYRSHIKAITEDGDEKVSETLDSIYNTFPFWFSKELESYRKREAELPFDCHFLKALVAPRVYLQTEAGSDIWANPVGAWQTTMAVGEVYKFLGAEDKLFWHYRDGYHYHKIRDIEVLVNVARHVFYGEELSENLFATPFEEPELMFDWRCPEANGK